MSNRFDRLDNGDIFEGTSAPTGLQLTGPAIGPANSENPLLGAVVVPTTSSEEEDIAFLAAERTVGHTIHRETFLENYRHFQRMALGGIPAVEGVAISGDVALPTRPDAWYFAVRPSRRGRELHQVFFVPIVYWTFRHELDVEVHGALENSLPLWVFEEVSPGRFAINLGITADTIHRHIQSYGFQENEDFTNHVQSLP